jgi:adenylate cyclase class IV
MRSVLCYLVRVAPAHSLRTRWLLHRQPLSTTTAEIERKFIYNDDILQYCKQHAGSSREVHMSDTYFDNAKLDLTTRDMWLRQRNDTLELKWPMVLDSAKAGITKKSGVGSLAGIDFYQESTDLPMISSVLQASADVTVKFDTSSRSFSEVRAALSSAGILSFGTVLTHRTRYNLNVELPAQLSRSNGGQASAIKLFVDIDSVRYVLPAQSQDKTVDSGVALATYQIGEVEFNFSEDTDNSRSGATGGVSSDQARHEAIMSHVFRVMGIQPAPVRGKVLEYLARHRPQHYEALRRSGQLASKGL